MFTLGWTGINGGRNGCGFRNGYGLNRGLPCLNLDYKRVQKRLSNLQFAKIPLLDAPKG
jgi:hypothetical protein